MDEDIVLFRIMGHCFTKVTKIGPAYYFFYLMINRLNNNLEPFIFQSVRYLLVLSLIRTQHK